MPLFRRTHRNLRLAFAIWLACLIVPAAFAAKAGFTPQARVGFTVGDQWEPAVATDGFGHTYILYPQYGRVPGCRNCPLPSMILVVSNDNGATWQPPREITPPATGQYDPQIVVDPVDRRTVYAAWLQSKKLDMVVAKSVDFGQSWSIVVADRGVTDADKPVLGVRAQDVYVGFNRDGKMWVASSHDGGITFTSTDVGPKLKLVRALAGGATVDLHGDVYLAWAGYTRQDGAKGRENLYVSKSSDGGGSWSTRLMDISGAPPDCGAYHCEWGYLGAQITMTSDAAGTLYTLWNSGASDKSPQRIYFASSTTAGDTWSPRLNVSTALSSVEHAFPALVAGEAGDVRIAWMDTRNLDTRNRPLWNVYYRSSTNGGATWSGESRISSYVPGYRYIRSQGFSFPFGDYFAIGIDNQGQTQTVWGEGLNFRSPGSIWYSNGR
ncbi:MAG TPA: sialidase family protein [Terriglobales bacterium]|nr:sialidase family protein [Terriglobales bacterium]